MWRLSTGCGPGTPGTGWREKPSPFTTALPSKRRKTRNARLVRHAPHVLTRTGTARAGGPFGKEVMPMRKRKKGSHVSIAWLAVVTTALIALTALLQLVGAAWA